MISDFLYVPCFPKTIAFIFGDPRKLQLIQETPNSFERYDYCLKGYALCRRPLLASEVVFLGFGVSILIFWGNVLAPRAHPKEPFWYLGTTLRDRGSSRMDSRWYFKGFYSILIWSWDLCILISWVQNLCLFWGLFPGHLPISKSIFRRLGFPSHDLRMEGIAKTVFHGNHF